MNGRRRPPTPATNTLMIVIVLAFGVEVVTGAWADPQLLSHGANMPMAYLRETGQYWRLFTSMFLHGDGTPVGGLMHVGVNLFSLWQLGSLYELLFGRRRFIPIYFIAGLAASITSAMHMPDNGMSVGASGAVLGILGAMISSILTSPRFRREPRARSLVAQCVFWALLNTVATANIAGIDNAAHIGGLLAGLLLGALLPHPQPPPQPPGSVTVDVHPE